MNPVINVQDVSKQYQRRSTKALDHVTFTIDEGEVIGLLGPNGAGKTTLIKLLCGVIPSTSGSISVLGVDPYREGLVAKQLVGVVHQHITFDLFLSVEDNLTIAAGFYGMSWSNIKPSAYKLLEVFQLSEYRKSTVFALSGGQQRRLQVIRTLLKRPRILILDEPSVGLDVASRHEVWTLLQTLRVEQEVTILWSSHYVEELERNCGRVLILNHGRVVEFERVTALVKQYGCPRIMLQFAEALDPALVSVLIELGSFMSKVTGNQLEVWDYGSSDPLSVILTTLQRLGCSPTDIKIIPGNLEDAYLTLTEGPQYAHDRFERYVTT